MTAMNFGGINDDILTNNHRTNQKNMVYLLRPLFQLKKRKYENVTKQKKRTLAIEMRIYLIYDRRFKYIIFLLLRIINFRKKNEKQTRKEID